MGGVLSAAPIGEAAVEFIRAGGDLCLICHREHFIVQAYEALIKEAERDSNFARRIAEAARRVMAFKKKNARTLRAGKSPGGATVEKLTRRLWEFGEELRLDAFSRRTDKRARS